MASLRYHGPPVLIVETGQTVTDGDVVHDAPASLALNHGFEKAKQSSRSAPKDEDKGDKEADSPGGVS